MEHRRENGVAERVLAMESEHLMQILALSLIRSSRRFHILFLYILYI